MARILCIRYFRLNTSGVTPIDFRRIVFVALLFFDPSKRHYEHHGNNRPIGKQQKIYNNNIEKSRKHEKTATVVCDINHALCAWRYLAVFQSFCLVVSFSVRFFFHSLIVVHILSLPLLSSYPDFSHSLPLSIRYFPRHPTSIFLMQFNLPHPWKIRHHELNSRRIELSQILYR